MVNDGFKYGASASREALLRQLTKAQQIAQLSPMARLIRWPVRTALPTALRKLGATRTVAAKFFFRRTFQCRLPEVVAAGLFRYGFFEADLTAVILRLLRPGDTFVDVGAHVGYFSALAARLVGADGRVVAFEPTPATREILVR